MARVAKIQGDVFETLTVVPNTVEYVLSTVATPEDENAVRVTPVILGKAQNTSAYTIPSLIVDALRNYTTPSTTKGK